MLSSPATRKKIEPPGQGYAEEFPLEWPLPLVRDSLFAFGVFYLHRTIGVHRPEAAKLSKNCQYAHLHEHLYRDQIRLVGWPSDKVPLAPGAGFNSQSQHKTQWQPLESAMLDGSLSIEPWTKGIDIITICDT